MLRDHAGPLALQTCYKQMQLSLFYSTEVMQRPHEVDSWTAYVLNSTQEPGFALMPGEENRMINSFENDRARVSMRWVISLITKRGLTVRHLLMVKHESTGVVHYIAVLPDGRYVCDCCMPSNLGVPCRHYFRIWIDVQKYAVPHLFDSPKMVSGFSPCGGIDTCRL
ncbi:hypothetical protein B0H14DRAFT_222894 [Mycena olivaceomarginata]|nr:hypothetical protein B0H14DRAFT_222894 [Mycena olivaceomarginata]